MPKHTRTGPLLIAFAAFDLAGPTSAQDDPASITARANAQAAQSAAVTASYTAQTAKYSTEEARLKAAAAQVPTSGLSNSASASDKAGLAEGNYLVAQATNASQTQVHRRRP